MDTYFVVNKHVKISFRKFINIKMLIFAIVFKCQEEYEKLTYFRKMLHVSSTFLRAHLCIIMWLCMRKYTN